MIELGGITAFNEGHLALRERGLDAHDRRCFGDRIGWLVSHQLEHFRDVRQVCLAQLFGFGVVLQVVIAIRQAEAALIGFGDHLRRVLVVLIRAEREQRSPTLERRWKLRSRDIFRQILLRLQTRDALQFRQQRLGAQLLDGRLIHTRRVEIADLLCDIVCRCVPRAACFRRFFQNRPQLRAIFVLELAGRTPTRLIRRNRIFFDPPAAGVRVEVHARINGSIDGRQIQHRLGRGVLRTDRHSGRKRGQNQNSDFPVHKVLRREIAL